MKVLVIFFFGITWAEMKHQSMRVTAALCPCVSRFLSIISVSLSGWMVLNFAGRSSQVRQRGMQYGERTWIECRENQIFISCTFIAKAVWFGERSDLSSSSSSRQRESIKTKHIWGLTLKNIFFFISVTYFGMINVSLIYHSWLFVYVPINGTQGWFLASKY